MLSRTDHDGKSKTASAVDANHYPEQNEAVLEAGSETVNAADHEEIAKIAYDLWQKRGCPSGSAEQDWAEASEMLRAKANSANAIASSSGSVQR